MRLYHCIYVKNNYQGKKDWNKSPSSQPWLNCPVLPLQFFGGVYSLTWFSFLCWSWSDEMNPPQVIRTLLPLLLESTTESVAEISSNSLERILGPAESDEFLARVYEKLITGCYNILANHADPNRWAWSRRIIRFPWPPAPVSEMYQHWPPTSLINSFLLCFLTESSVLVCILCSCGPAWKVIWNLLL